MRQPVSRGLSIGMTVVTLVAIGQSGLATAQTVEWPAYAADQAGTKYLPLDQITKENVADLEIVWRQPVIPDAIRNGETTRGPVGSQDDAAHGRRAALLQHGVGDDRGPRADDRRGRVEHGAQSNVGPSPQPRPFWTSS